MGSGSRTASIELPVLLSLTDTVQVLGLALFFAGIATGMLLVFADRHGYERPVSPRALAALLALGILVASVGRVGQQMGL